MAERPLVLVLGDSEDPHVRAVVEELAALRARAFVQDVWAPGEVLTVDLAEGAARLSGAGGPLEVHAIWNRLKPRLGGGLSEAEAFAVRERRSFLTSLGHVCGVANLINDPVAQDYARRKPWQLRVARDVGFRIPETWLTNDEELIGARVGEHDTVYKPLTWLASMDGRVLFTNVVTQDLVDRHRDALALAPGIYQRRVPKRVEYRVTVVDDRIFTARILSQDRADTALDWRRNQGEVEYEVASLPDEVEGRTLAMMCRLGLRYSAFDFIEDPNGEFVFLETNPGGNWLWLEERLGLEISRALAEALSRPEHAPSEVCPHAPAEAATPTT